MLMVVNYRTIFVSIVMHKSCINDYLIISLYIDDYDLIHNINNVSLYNNVYFLDVVIYTKPCNQTTTDDNDKTILYFF